LSTWLLDSWEKAKEPLSIYVYPGERLHKGLDGHYS